MATRLPRPSEGERNTDRIRVTFDLTPPMMEILEGLAVSAGTSQATVLRNAIALLKTAKAAQSKGEEIALLDRDGRVTAKLVGF